MAESTTLGLLILSGVRHAASYLPLFAAHPNTVVRAVCEEAAAPEWARRDSHQIAEQYGIPFLADPAAALARADVDLVLVCSEPTRHARLAAQALHVGKHVLIDKPMATTLEEATQVLDAAATAPGKCTVIHRLYGTSIQRTRHWIDAGHIGLVRSVDIEFLSNGVQFATAVERPEFVVDPALSGGGELLNFMVYPVDYLRYLTGAEVVEVYAEAGTFFFAPHRQFGVEDAGVLSLLLEHDIIASLTIGRVPYAPTVGTVASSLRLIGSHGHLTVDESRPQLDIWSTVTDQRGRTIGGDTAQASVAAEINTFIDDILRDRTPLYGPRDGWAAIAAIDAAYRSIATGQPARVRRLEE